MPSKPLHPAVIHFPLTLLLLSTTLDTLHALSLRSLLPPTLLTYLPVPTSDLPFLAYHALALGLLSSLPAILTGILELTGMILKSGLFEPGTQTLKQKVKTGILHAGLSDVAIATWAYTFFERRKNVLAAEAKMGAVLGGQGLGRGVEWKGYAVEEKWVLGQGVALLVLVLAAGLGADLVYRFGVGFSVGTGTKETRKDQKKVQ